MIFPFGISADFCNWSLAGDLIHIYAVSATCKRQESFLFRVFFFLSFASSIAACVRQQIDDVFQRLNECTSNDRTSHCERVQHVSGLSVRHATISLLCIRKLNRFVVVSSHQSLSLHYLSTTVLLGSKTNRRSSSSSGSKQPHKRWAVIEHGILLVNILLLTLVWSWWSLREDWIHLIETKKFRKKNIWKSLRPFKFHRGIRALRWKREL